MYTYPWYHWLTFFYIYCFFGWIFESTYVSLKSRRFVNRGFLRLPLLPLYGTGAVMMLWLSLPVKDNVFLVYLAGVAGATVLEYATGYVMERLFKMKYWDYSNQRFNVKGYICLSSSIAWGFLTIFLTEIIHTPIAEFVLSLPLTAEVVMLITVSCLFAADTVFSVREALDLGRALESITAIKAELDALREEAAAAAENFQENLQESLQENLSPRAAELAQKAALRVREAAERSADMAREAAERSADLARGAAERSADLARGAAERSADLARGAAERSADLAREKHASALSHMRTLSEKQKTLLNRISSRHKGILRRNPTASSLRFAKALKELREYLDERQ